MSESKSALAGTIPGEHIHISVDDCTAPFWEAAKQRRLSALRCGDCGRFQMPPTPFCPQCQSRAMDWVDLTGEATVYSYAVVRGLPQFPDLVLVHPRQRRILWRELKSETGTATAEQKAWISALSLVGADVDVWRPRDWVSGRIERELRGQ